MAKDKIVSDILPATHILNAFIVPLNGTWVGDHLKGLLQQSNDHKELCTRMTQAMIAQQTSIDAFTLEQKVGWQLLWLTCNSMLMMYHQVELDITDELLQRVTEMFNEQNPTTVDLILSLLLCLSELTEFDKNTMNEACDLLTFKISNLYMRQGECLMYKGNFESKTDEEMIEEYNDENN